jgi:hypothetical protein
MTRLCAVIFIASALAGCRGSQPATNPFLRTTVPPPATGQGMMVMPGEAAPVVVTPGVPGAPSAVAPGVPVAPAQPAPLIGPPPVSPQKEEFKPPGGDYLFHQSSHQRPGADAVSVAARELAAAAPDVSQHASLPASPQASDGAVRQAGYAESSFPSTTANGSKLVFRARAGVADSRGDPPETVAPMTAGRDAAANAVRIVGPSNKDAVAGAAQSSTTGPVFRMTVGEDPSTSASAVTSTSPGALATIKPAARPAAQPSADASAAAARP